MRGKNNSFFGKKHSEETRAKISASRVGQKKPAGSGNGIPPQKISVFDKDTNESTIFCSINAAARALNINPGRITEFFKNNTQKPYKGRYIFAKL